MWFGVNDWTERIVVDQSIFLEISVGYMHSRYPIMAHMDLADRMLDLADQFVSSVHRFDARIQHSGPRVNSHTEYLGDGQLPTGHSRKYWTSWEHRRASW